MFSEKLYRLHIRQRQLLRERLYGGNLTRYVEGGCAEIVRTPEERYVPRRRVDIPARPNIVLDGEI